MSEADVRAKTGETKITNAEFSCQLMGKHTKCTRTDLVSPKRGNLQVEETLISASLGIPKWKYTCNINYLYLL